MRLSKQKSIASVRSYCGKTFFGLTVITAVIWVNGHIFFFPPREFVGAYLHWKFEVYKCCGCRGIAGQRHTHTHTHTHIQTLTCDIDPVPISICFKFWIWNIKSQISFKMSQSVVKHCGLGMRYEFTVNHKEKVVLVLQALWQNQKKSKKTFWCHIKSRECTGSVITPPRNRGLAGRSA